MFRSIALRVGAAVTALLVAAVVVSASGALAIAPRGEKGGSVADPPAAVAPLPSAEATLDWRVIVLVAVVAVAVALAGLADSSAWRHAHRHRHA
jgi:hypothetical protein